MLRHRHFYPFVPSQERAAEHCSMQSMSTHFGVTKVGCQCYRPVLEPAAVNAERSGGAVWQRTAGGMVRDGGGVAQLVN